VPQGNADTIVKSLEPFHKGTQGRDLVYKAALTGFFTYETPSCHGGGIGGPGIGTGLLSAGLGSVPIVGGTLQKIFGIFGAHHAAAVKTEQATLCQAVPDANNFLRSIDAALAQGQIDVSTAAQALEQGYEQWLPEIQGIMQEHGDTCNAACIYRKAFRAAIEKRKQDYAIITAQNAAGAQGVSGGVVSTMTAGVSSFARRVVGAVSDVLSGGSAPASSPALAQAGLTPARQSTLALFLVGGVVLLSVALFSNLFGGNSK